jgi:MFS family permease
MSALFTTTSTRNAPSGVFAALVPIMAVVFVAFLVIGFSLPVLPLHVSYGLGLGAFAVGLVTGSQFVASLLSRVWAGHYSDRKGVKRGVASGLVTAFVAGLLYLLSLGFLQAPLTSVTILLLGRATLGTAESLVITSAVNWGLALVGAQNAGKVIAWVGTAMFAALALGAPIGTALYGVGGFAAVAVATIIAPLATLLLVARRPAIPPSSIERKPAFMSVISAVWMPGIGAALSSIGFGAILTFGSLLFARQGWSPVWLMFTAYAAALIATRLVLGHLPDRLGGARVAILTVLIEAAGLALIWLAPGPLVAGGGAAITGFGYALVYPALGVEAVNRAPPHSRGLVMGVYTAFLDVALGLGSPALGLVAERTGVASVFLASAFIVLCAAILAALLLTGPPATAGGRLSKAADGLSPSKENTRDDRKDQFGTLYVESR